MDIKLVKNFEEGVYIPVNNEVLLQIIDDNYQLGEFNGKKIFMLNPETNERFEVMPGIEKYSMSQIYYAARDHSYIVFTSAQRLSEQMVKVIFYRYMIDQDDAIVIYTVDISLNELGNKTRLKTFVLDENHCIFEKIHSASGAAQLLSQPRQKEEFSLILHDIVHNQDIKLSHSMLAEEGIDQIIALNGNMCVVKIGSSRIQENVFETPVSSGNEEIKELIGIINTKQFISDLALNPENVSIDPLDSGFANVTFPYIRHYDSDIVYSKVDLEKKREEIIIYNYETKVKKVRINTDIMCASDLSHTYLIDDVPYLIKDTEKAVMLVNLNTQKSEWKWGSDVRVRFIRNDLIVTERHVKKMFFMRKESNYIEVFRFPDIHHAVFKTRARYKDCVVHGEDLLIFTR